MATRVMGISLALALVSVLLFAHRASAQPSGCTSAIVSLAPCLNYITGNSSTPTASCCTSLAAVVKTQSQCLCTLLNSSAAQFGLNINQTLALTLPGACKVQTPPLSQCNAAAPAASPAEAPSAPTAPTVPGTSAPTTPTVPATPSTPGSSTPTPSVPAGRGSNTVPSPTGQPSDASSLIKSTRSVIFTALFAVACVSSLVV
ncbi:putative LRR receptor-like serine/threonine-protein kinase [Iris pallida]|uniref:LRR receptor-like serine/threonine-protein kinase n=1 Tax=Iris pallida TaxID=29817 RepID=A0AAX6E9Q6_IRIPA|nr:non-specific lipid-transfer protein-like protein [Iris pallida]KAJ6817025.1 putative LRR receptor-like serine/threonine-protein kinase [Iris pallida]